MQNADSPSILRHLAAAALPAATPQTVAVLLANARPAGPIPAFDSLKDRIA